MLITKPNCITSITGINKFLRKLRDRQFEKCRQQEQESDNDSQTNRSLFVYLNLMNH